MGKLREKYKGFNYFSTLKVNIIKLNSDNIKQISKKKTCQAAQYILKWILVCFYISFT